MFAYSKKEYESIDPVELPAEITDAQVTSGVGTDEVLLTPTKLKTAITTHAPTGGDTLPAQVNFTSYSCCSISINSYPAFIGIIKTSVCR
jgi:hypothetical protein